MLEYCTDEYFFRRGILLWAATELKKRGTYFKGSSVQPARVYPEQFARSQDGMFNRIRKETEPLRDIESYSVC